MRLDQHDIAPLDEAESVDSLTKNSVIFIKITNKLILLIFIFHLSTI